MEGGTSVWVPTDYGRARTPEWKKSKHRVLVVIHCASWFVSGCYHKDWYTLWWDRHRVSTRKRGPIDTDTWNVNASKEPIDRVVRVHLACAWQLGWLRWNPHDRCTPEGYHNYGDWDHVIILYRFLVGTLVRWCRDRYKNLYTKVVAKQRKGRSAFSLSCLNISYAYPM